MLRLEQVSRRAGGRPIVRDVSLELDAGEIVSLVGPTGSGKTSLLRLVMGLDRLDGGRIWWGDELLAEADRSLCAPHLRGFSLVFQDTLLLPFVSVEHNVLLGAGRRDGEARRRFSEVVGLLDLEGLTRRSAWKLSGGEQQRVALARSLVVAPRLLLLDEPFSNLDRMAKERLFPALRDYLVRESISTVFVTHDRHEAFFFGRRMFVMGAGRLLQGGTPEDLYRRPASREVAELLGECNVLGRADAAELFGLEPEEEARQVVLIRPELLALDARAPACGTLEAIELHGFHQTLVLRSDRGPVLRVKALTDEPYAVGTRYGVRLKEAAWAVWCDS
ncbi:MAG: ABC transporter ATP-binding protein [Deltaproteobacteria bacterium]|nr:ABC transporter ATP-binding protein [Deltaproteobacteria bacterium]